MSTNSGFQTDFIGPSLEVDFPALSEDQKKDLAIFDQQSLGELTYPHFSLFLSKSRKFPFFTATNIDGSLFKPIPRNKIFPSGKDEWSLDERASGFQWGEELYNAEKSDFQHGHMTKREDPQWGKTNDIALNAAIATFHYANCVPQVAELNTEEWGKLETFILEKTSVPDKLRVCVLTGPVLSDRDPVFVTKVNGEEVKLPALFWKIVYYSGDGKQLGRAAFLMGQMNSLLKRGIVAEEAKPFLSLEDDQAGLFQNFDEKAIYQVNIATIEMLSHLTFSPGAEPYRDNRPLKLIITKVQVPAATAERHGMNVEDRLEEVLFSNMQLHLPGD